jgi:hypothetical protein
MEKEFEPDQPLTGLWPERRWFEWVASIKEKKYSGSSIIAMGSLTGNRPTAIR